MRCRACDCALTDFEATRRYNDSSEFLDLCAKCFSYVVGDFDTVERFEMYDPDIDVIDFGNDENPHGMVIVRDNDPTDPTTNNE